MKEKYFTVTHRCNNTPTRRKFVWLKSANVWATQCLCGDTIYITH